MAIDKLVVYNGALALIGERKLASDSENRESRFRLDTLWEMGAVEFCLDMAKPHWASSIEKLDTPTTVVDHSLSQQHDFPSDYISIVGLYSDPKLDQEVHRYIIQGRSVLTEYETVWLRYISNTPVDTFTNWTPNFVQLVSAHLANQLAPTFAAQKTEALAANFASVLNATIDLEGIKEPFVRSSQSTRTISAEYLKVYNDALQILGLPHMVDANDDSDARSKLDIALSNDLVLTLMETYSWFFPGRTQKLMYDPGIEPDWGFKRVFNKPSDHLRTKGVFADENMVSPLRLYVEEGGLIFANQQEIFLNYISKSTVDSPAEWPPSFRKLVAAQMAVDAGPSIPNANFENALVTHRGRERAARNTDAMQSPPQRIARGSWTSSRGTDRYINNGRP